MSQEGEEPTRRADAERESGTSEGTDEDDEATEVDTENAELGTVDGAVDAFENATRAGEDAGEEEDGDADEAADGDSTADDESSPSPGVPDAESDEARDIPEDVQKYARFQKMDGAQYERVNEFLRDRTYITAREWAIARLCADFRTETGVEMTKIGENLPELVPFMTDTYTPQAVNQARSAFEEKVRKAGATFLYGAMCDFFTADQLDDVMYEVTEIAKFLLEVEGVDLTVDEELDAEERISSVMRDVRQASDELRHHTAECPHCGGDLTVEE